MKNERWMAILLMVMVVACSLSFLILGRNVVRLVNVRQQSIEYALEMEEVQPLPVDDELEVRKPLNDEEEIEGQLSVLELDTAEMDYQKWHQLLQASLKQNKANPPKQVPATMQQEETLTQRAVQPMTIEVIQPVDMPLAAEEEAPQLDLLAAKFKAQEEAEKPKSLSELAVEQWRNEREKREQQDRMRVGLNVEDVAPQQPPEAVEVVADPPAAAAAEVPAVIEPVTPQSGYTEAFDKIGAKVKEGRPAVDEAELLAAEAERKRRNAVLAIVRKRKEAALRARP